MPGQYAGRLRRPDGVSNADCRSEREIACDFFAIFYKSWSRRGESRTHERTVWTRMGLCRRCAFCVTSMLLLLTILNEDIVMVSARQERHAVIKGIHGDAIPWAKGRQSDPGVGRYWRRCHARFRKEVQVRSCA